ncbi:hypothetical protein ACFRJ8_15155 [Arthrobacter sp. NPDC056886]
MSVLKIFKGPEASIDDQIESYAIERRLGDVDAGWLVQSPRGAGH